MYDMYHTHVSARRPDKDVRSPGIGIPSSWEPPDVAAGTELSHLSGPFTLFIVRKMAVQDSPEALVNS